jgi:hypothetical protein
MTAEVLNLRRHRKQKAREDRQRTAEVNRARFGRTKAERDQDDRLRQQAARRLDGHVQDREPEDDR